MARVVKGIIRHICNCRHSIYLIISDFLQNVLASGVCCPLTIRQVLYRVAGNKIGKHCYFSPRCFLGPGKGRLHVGEGTFINYNCWFDLGDDIQIGRNCNIAMNVHFINGAHEIGSSERRAGHGVTKKIIVGDGTWIGADSIIMPGVTIGKGTIIGAGSLVVSDCNDDTIYIGRPAKIHKRL